MDLIKELLGELGSELVTEVLVPGLLILILLVLALPVYFIMRRVMGRKTTLSEDLLGTFTRQPVAQSPYVEELSSLRSGLETFGLYAIYGAIVLVTGFIIYFFATLRDDANKAFLQAIFGIGYLVFMLFAVGQALAIKYGRRQRQRQPISFDKTSRARTINFSFEFGIGGPPAQAKVQIDSVPDEDKLDADALETAQSHLDIGEGLENVCRSINPQFADWRRPRQEAYKAYLRKALEERRQRGVTQAPSPEPAVIPIPVEEAKAPGKKLFTTGQLVLIVMVFFGALAMFLAVMMVSSRMRS